ncbi:Roundabout 1 [Mactra antiquata]
MIKTLSIVITAMLNMHSIFGNMGLTLRDLDGPVAKRGGHRVVFKGEEFQPETTATRHEDIVLECEAGGRPTPTIHWLKNGERIQQGLSRDYLDDAASFEEKLNDMGKTPMLRLGKVKSKLFLDCVSERDEAVYTCVAETPFDRISQTTKLVMGNSLSSMSRSSCLTKKAFRGEPARIHLWTSVRLEFQGAPVQLFCRADGYPAPVCQWKYTEVGLPIVDDDEFKLLPNGDLLINTISWENMGDYYCTCENEAGVDQVSTFLYPTAP